MIEISVGLWLCVLCGLFAQAAVIFLLQRRRRRDLVLLHDQNVALMRLRQQRADIVRLMRSNPGALKVAAGAKS